MPAAPARLPFVLLIVGLLSAGLITLLLLNTATASGSFTESALSERNAKLTLQQQELERSVGLLNTPAGLANAAQKLGMVPGGDPVYLVIKPDGTSKVIGTPTPAAAPPAPPPPAGTDKPKKHQNDTDHHGTTTGGNGGTHGQQHQSDQHQSDQQSQNTGQQHQANSQQRTTGQQQNTGQHTASSGTPAGGGR